MDEKQRLGTASEELVRAGLEAGTTFRFRIVSESMRPALRAGDDVLVSKVDWRRLRAGDIVLCDTGRVLVAHRLLGIRRRGGEPELLTKGDANRREDVRYGLAAYRGRVMRVERGGRTIDLDSAPGRIAAGIRARISLGQAMFTRLYRKLKKQLGLAALLVAALWLIHATGALAAVTISSFTATGGNNQIVLKWTTATELKNFAFNIERSSDQATWSKIGTVSSQSPCVQSLTTLNYTYTDNNLPPSTKYYYRLQMVGSPCGDPDTYYDQVVNATTAGGAPSSTPTATNTSRPGATPTFTPRATATNTSPPPGATPTFTPRATATSTSPPPSATPTNTPVLPSATPSDTPLPPSATPSDTPVPPSATPTNAPLLPSATPTPPSAAYPLPGTNSPTALAATPAPLSTLLAGDTPSPSFTPAAGGTPAAAATSAVPAPTDTTGMGGDSTQSTVPGSPTNASTPGATDVEAAQDTAQPNTALPIAAGAAALALLGGGAFLWRRRRLRPPAAPQPPTDEP